MSEVEAAEIAESLLRVVDWSWGDSTQRYAWWDRLNYLKNLNPLMAEAIQMIRYRKYQKWQEYSRFWANQRRLRMEERRKTLNRTD